MAEENKEVKTEEVEVKKVDTKVEADEKTESVVIKEKEVNINIKMPRVEDDKKYTSAEIKQMINDSMAYATTITKTQLHDTIDKQNSKIEALEKLTKGSDATEKALLEQERVKLVSQLEGLQSKMSVLENGLVSEREKTITLSENIKKEKLDSFREKIIAQAQGNIIPELVYGITEEEIIASAEKAKNKFNEIWTEQRKKLGLPDTKVEKTEQQEAVDIKRIPMDANSVSDWSANRKAIKAQILAELKLT